ncbi:MAG TPA: methyltransferase domain-containing protein, partial [Actinomycetota bacterium]|nr:methyltransferase domain-containing protein [Actinomycetota bacterium]
RAMLDRLPEEATEAFAGVANPFYWGLPKPGEKVVDLGSGAGMDSFIAAMSVGASGRVFGVDMTPEMVERATRLAQHLGLDNVEFRRAFIEDLPIEDEWADVVISNGVINLCPDKLGVYQEVHRVLKPGGRMTIADICVEKPVPEGALKDIDLWTG